MYGHFQDVLHSARATLAQENTLNTNGFSANQRALIQSLVGAAMADLSWQSPTDPNAEKKWELPKVGVEVANTIVSSAARFAGAREFTEEEVRNFAATPDLRRIAAETRTAVLNHLDRRARGQ